MSKNIKRTSKDLKEGPCVSIKEAEEPMERYRRKKKEILNFEFYYFMMALSTLICTNVYIHKANLNNYNFKVILLIIFYFSRRLLMQLYYHYRIREHLIFKRNKAIFYVVLFQVVINVIYIFWDLLLNYSIYSLLPLFYFSLLHIPMFKLDVDKKYENAPKEMVRCLKKISFFSLEVCYYGIFIPVFFSMKYSPFLNMLAIFIYAIFTWVNFAFMIFCFLYYKKSAEFHFHSKIYGNWKKLKKSEISVEKFQKIKTWVFQPYEKDSIVEYKGKYYLGLEERNYVEPNNIYAHWLYIFFANPNKTFWAILLLQGCVTIFQLTFYIITQLNIFSLNLSTMSWYTFYTTFTLSKKIKFIFNKK